MSRSAHRDIERIDSWIESRGNAIDARRWSARLYDAISTLAAFPRRCPLAPERVELQREMRHLLIDDYRILFTVDRTTVVVLRVRHCRQDTATREELASALAELRDTSRAPDQ